MKLAAVPINAVPNAIPKLGSPVSPRASQPILLASKDQHGRGFITAASGIARTGGSLWVAPDDLTSIAELHADGPATLHRALKANKTNKDGITPKPDLESIVTLPATATAPNGWLLTLGSGSAPTRERGAAWRLDGAGRPEGKSVTVHLKQLFHAFSKQLPDGVNIEAATTTASRLVLVHRGQDAGDTNRAFTLNLAAVGRALDTDGRLTKAMITSTKQIDLGQLHGVPLGISDAKTLPDGRIIFTASAEGPDEGHGDGSIQGSVVGVLGPRLALQSVHLLSGPARKVEGIEFDGPATAKAAQVLLVTDEDDPQHPSELLQARVPLP